MHRLSLIVICLHLFYSTLCQKPLPASFNENIAFHRLSTENGLPHDYINSVIRDQKGFLWIGTGNGLARYDGSRFIVFQSDPKDTSSISDDNVLHVSIDRNGNIWAGTYWKGLNQYNERTGKFISYKNQENKPTLLSNNYIPALAEPAPGHWLIPQGELILLNIKSRTARQIDLPVNTWSEKLTKNVPTRFRADNVFIDSKNKWWITGSAGLIIYDPMLQKMILFCERPNVPNTLKNNTSIECAEDAKGNIWIAGDGLYQYDQKNDQLIQHYPTRFSPADYKTNIVTSVLCHSDGSIWFGTTNGLFHYEPLSGKYAVYRNHPKHSLSVSDNGINCLYEDQQNIIWIGTQNGLNAVYPSSSAFKSDQPVEGDDQSIQSSITQDAYKDDEGNLWIATSNGLECIDAKTKKPTRYFHFDPRIKNPLEYNVKAIHPYDQQYLWLGTWGCGLQLFDLKKRKFIASYAVSNDSNTIGSNFIKSIVTDPKGNIWLGTWNGGVEKMDPVTKSFKHYTRANVRGMVSNYVSRLYWAYNTLWVGTNKGLLQYNSTNDSFQLHILNSDSSFMPAAGVSAIESDQQGNLWIGTFKGLLQFNVSNRQVHKIESLGNNGVFAIHQEKKGSIWLATSRGLTHYLVNSEELNNYSVKDGIPVSYFPLDCNIRPGVEGELMVSSTKGLIHFYPSRIEKNLQRPPLILTSIKIANQAVDSILYSDSSRRIKLNYKNNSISFSFAALNLIHADQNLFSYKMEGLDDDWIFAGNRSEATYPNLPPGKYIFKVKAANNSGLWTEQALEVRVHVAAPWWRTWWFYVLCILSAFLLGYGLYRSRLNRILAEQKLRNKIARDLHDDIGSTLSGIKLFSSMAQQQLQQERSIATPMVKKIGERSERMIEAMSDIVWSINPSNDSLEQMLVRMKQYAAEMLEPNSIELSFRVDERMTKIRIPPEDRKEVYLIYKEILNNAVKHSQCTRVMVSMELVKKRIELTVVDNGIGFDASLLSGKGNGMHNLQYRTKNINGDITITSSAGTGTSIKLSFPVT